jgi:hypothetical protein
MPTTVRSGFTVRYVLFRILFPSLPETSWNDDVVLAHGPPESGKLSVVSSVHIGNLAATSTSYYGTPLQENNGSGVKSRLWMRQQSRMCDIHRCWPVAWGRDRYLHCNFARYQDPDEKPRTEAIFQCTRAQGSQQTSKLNVYIGFAHKQ